MPRRPYSRRILVREGRAEPATSVRGATHIQVVSRATRDQADPLAPAGRRFGNFVFGAMMELGRCGERCDAAAAGRALGATGYRQTGGIERSALSCPVVLTRAESSCARGAPSQRRRSAERPTFRWSAERPAIRRPAGAGWAALRQFRFWGDDGFGVRGERCAMLPPPAARWEVRGIAKQAALKDQRYRAPSSLFAPNPRARGARRASDVGPRSDPHSGGQQSDPRSGRPAGAGWAALRQFRFWGDTRWRTIDAAAAGRALGGTGYRQTGGIERSALSCPVVLTRAESSCARGAPSQRRRSAERPTFRWSAERPAIRPTRWRRLGGASAISFLGATSGAIDAAAAGRALGGTGYRQTGGIERSALSCPVILVRADSSCARGAPSQRRRSAERPTFRWSAERPAIRPTRWRRLGGASAISFLGRRWSSGVRGER